jgi:integrase
MSIRKRGEFYSFEFMEKGERYRGTFNGRDGLAHARTKQEARDCESEIRIQVRQGKLRKEVRLEDLGKFFDEVYMRYAREHKMDWQHDEFRGEVLKNFFAGKRFSEITPMLVVSFINDRLKSKTKRGTVRHPVTVHHEVQLLSSIFNMAVKEGAATVNPCLLIPKSVKKKIPARNKRDRFLTAEEETRLFNQLKGRRSHLAPIVRFALDTGLRRSELCRLEVSHVNLSGTVRDVTLPNGKVARVEPGEVLVTRGKNGKSRAVPLTNEARRIAQLQLLDVTNKQYLFTSKRSGGAIAEIKTGFAGAVTDAEIENFRFHDLRHTFATRLNEAGVDPVTRRDLLGHSTIEMSDDYTHSSLEGRHHAIQVLSANGRDSDLDYVRIAS